MHPLHPVLSRPCGDLAADLLILYTRQSTRYLDHGYLLLCRGPILC